MRDDRVLVFEFYRKGLGGNDGLAVLKNFEKALGAHAMIVIVGKPDLKLALTFVTNRSATVDKVFFHKGYFGDMEVSRDEGSIGELNANVFFFVSQKGRFEFGDSHD